MKQVAQIDFLHYYKIWYTHTISLISDIQGWICEGVEGFAPYRTDGRPSHRKSEKQIRGCKWTPPGHQPFNNLVAYY